MLKQFAKGWRELHPGRIWDIVSEDFLDQHYRLNPCGTCACAEPLTKEEYADNLNGEDYV